MSNLKTISRTSTYIIVASLLLFLALRIPLVYYPYYGDEEHLLRAVVVPLGSITNAESSLFIMWLLKIGYFLFGWTQMRWIPLFFSTGSFFLCVLAARDFFEEQPVWLPAFLFTISPWNICVSTQLDYEGGFLTFFTFLTVYLYLKCIKRNPTHWRDLIYCGVALGFAWLCKFSALLVFGGIGVYSLLFRGIIKTIKELATIFITACAIFALYPILYPFHYKYSSQKALGAALSLHWQPFSLFSPYIYLSSMSKPIILMGPLFIIAFLWLLLPKIKRTPEMNLFLCIILTKIALLLYMINPQRSLMYWSPLAPLLCLLSGQLITQLWEKQNWRALIIGTGCFTALFVLMSLGPKSIAAIHPRIALSQLTYSSYLTVRMFYGPSLAFFVKSFIVFLAFGGSMVLGLLALRNKNWGKHLVSLGVAYALFCSVEFTYAFFSPSAHRAGDKLLETLKTEHWQEPIYVHGYSQTSVDALALRTCFFHYDVGLIPTLTKIMKREKGTLVLSGAPLIGNQTELKLFLKDNATLAKTISDSGVSLVEIWTLN